MMTTLVDLSVSACMERSWECDFERPRFNTTLLSMSYFVLTTLLFLGLLQRWTIAPIYSLVTSKDHISIYRFLPFALHVQKRPYSSHRTNTHAGKLTNLQICTSTHATYCNSHPRLSAQYTYATHFAARTALFIPPPALRSLCGS